jgi:hypothetical protein
MRLSTGHRRWVYWSSAILFASGALWLVLHYFGGTQGQFEGAPSHPLETWCLRAHGAGAMLVLLVVGTLIPIHIRRGWHQRRNRVAGSILAATAFVLIATGYALYYCAGEDTRFWISVLHWSLGLGALPLLILHVALGKARPAKALDEAAATARFEAGRGPPATQAARW